MPAGEQRFAIREHHHVRAGARLRIVAQLAVGPRAESTLSTDSAATFSANVRVTSSSSDYDGNPNGPGDYSGIAQVLSANTSYPFWASHLASDILNETGTAGAFEIYTAPVIH